MMRHAISCGTLLWCTLFCAVAHALPPAARDAQSTKPKDKEQENQTADQACGQDRRCRIERLKRQTRARRYTTMLREERVAEQVTQEMTAKSARRSVRLADPLWA